MKDYFFKIGSIWIFNFFCFFYMGGVWECMIGFVRRILDFMFFKIYEGNFIYDVFVIFMVEVLVIINNR